MGFHGGLMGLFNGFMGFDLIYPLVIQREMENHHFYWENSP